MFLPPKGKIELVLDKSSYKPGEEIKGILKLYLENPVKARALRVAFYGVKEEYYVKDNFMSTSRYPEKRKRKMKVAEAIVFLDGEKEYTSNDYPFVIKIPPEAATHLAELVSVSLGPLSFQYLKGGGSLRFFLDASLDIPLTFDLNTKKEIKIEPA
ncbi:MAG: hypothetical protein QW035_01045 [Candidatus Anstonellales archaeon]